jgi:hypothetical protein
MTNLTGLISPAEKMLKKALKEGKIEMLDNTEYNEIWDDIDKIMEDVHRDYIINNINIG